MVEKRSMNFFFWFWWECKKPPASSHILRLRNVKAKRIRVIDFSQQQSSISYCNRWDCFLIIIIPNEMLECDLPCYGAIVHPIPRADWLLDSIANEPFSRQVDNMCRLQTRGRSHFHFIVLGQDCEGTHDGAPKVDLVADGGRPRYGPPAGGGPDRVVHSSAPLTS